MRTDLLLVLGVVGLFGAACSGGPDLGPELSGFHSGGIEGAGCPPASTTKDTCGNPDCGVACYADTVCDPDAPECPPGYECDDSLEIPYCLPGQICDAKAPCSGGAYCARAGLSQGICVPIEGEVPECSDNQCPWPYMCREGACVLWCLESECPAGMACVEMRCIAAE